MADNVAENTHSPTGRPLYAEHLRAPIWSWCVMLSLTLALAFALYVPLGPVAGLLALAGGTTLSLLLLVGTSVTIGVYEDELKVGSAHIGWDYTGLIATLDAPATTTARTTEADPRAYAVMRPLSARESVTVEVIDDEDPHPYWLISSRDSASLGHAMARAQRQHFSHR